MFGSQTLIATGHFERAHNHLTLHSGNGADLGKRARRGVDFVFSRMVQMQANLFRGDFMMRVKNCQLQNQVSQLTNVAAPLEMRQQLQRFRCESRVGTVALQEILSQCDDVLMSLPQWRNLDMHLIDAMVKVSAESPIFY